MPRALRNVEELAKGRYGGKQFCCSGWATMEQETSYSPIAAKFSAYPDYRFEGYFAQAISHYEYSQATSGTDQDPVGEQMHFCPWCGSQQPGAQEFYA